MRSGAPRSVVNCPSSAASLTGCHSATARALTSPDSGCSIAAGAPTHERQHHRMAMERRVAPLSSTNAWIAGHREARRRVRREQHVQRLLKRRRIEHARDRIDADDLARRPIVSPVGVFIQALTMTTNTADAAPLIATIAARP